ncbi:MAG: SDR family oxidoreductase [Polyangiales bacterium]
MSRVALITGASRGLGGALTRALLADGWRVQGCFRDRDRDAETLRADLDADARERLTLTRCDLADGAARARWCADALQREGGCDALVHAAGPFLRAPLLEQSPDDLRALYEVNVVALHALACAAAPSMRARRGGRVVSFGLASTHRGAAPPVLAAYYCAKAAATSLVRALARELAPDQITANVVSPGVINSGGLDAAELHRLQPTIPAGYVGEPRDAVAAARWLLSDEARYVSGSEILVSGAWGL